jgi:hypothetical protein
MGSETRAPQLMALLHLKNLYTGIVTTTTAPGQTIFTVPAGQRWVLREADYRNLSSAGSFSFFIYVDSVLVYTDLLAASASGQWTGNLVLNPGQVLSFRSGTATGMGTTASGTVYTI